mmetsp:Transcript_13853/g.30197  ORF Transcript_13853/g.30197 Transcript_13853/m.30197 type:complete len:221 (+) Transcript_13853:126-788(+)|eukprot:CAMPEP_0206482048 /NCGR_PEP_ID=MMETSP0324_2-20121206/38601_1 /ASSEMBLY_ACC=CAM_ASM_000836 /TAXON_ID=2866 /ORGANISM="Crypthecodinium cohnii, Strain Seligo" /LENGTH=220 /DNA_ID=CAMNT_0053959839 /DNA_START=123 /DNA_END=785 /DNA_ORIENTATION=-
MAPSSELAEMLQKRRSKGEAVYESHTYRGEPLGKDGNADAPGTTNRPDSDVLGSENSLEGIPPWLAAAADYGVLFYDPDGREIEVPSSQVPDFKACLEKFRDFERTWKSSQEAVKANAEAKATAAATTKTTAAAQPTSSPTPSEAVATTMVTAGAATGSSDGTDPAEGGAEADDQQEPVPLNKEDLKTLVQKHYFDLVRQGYEPNEAAAKALTEAVSRRM